MSYNSAVLLIVKISNVSRKTRLREAQTNKYSHLRPSLTNCEQARQTESSN